MLSDLDLWYWTLKPHFQTQSRYISNLWQIMGGFISQRWVELCTFVSIGMVDTWLNFVTKLLITLSLSNVSLFRVDFKASFLCYQKFQSWFHAYKDEMRYVQYHTSRLSPISPSSFYFPLNHIPINFDLWNHDPNQYEDYYI